MNKPLSKLQQHRASRLVPKSKRLREYRDHVALQHDIDVAIGLAYDALVIRAAAHNVAVGAYAEPRAAPAIH